jgi:phosphatidylserine/phosphatidylglycerophosphate/cardiolipin synthase-like enzyme/uncharacterized membrane protein YdjX (TVP38/TMEM64 family)
VNCGAVARANRVGLLVDGDAYFHAFRRAAENAERSIALVGWDFDSSTVLDPGTPEAARLGDFLNDLVRRRRRLHVRILDWDFPVIFGMDRELSPAYGFSWKPHRRVRFRYDNTHPVAGSQHQKIVVIDERIAFCGGLDLACKRWDTPGHAPHDPRRVAAGKPYPPFHDMMMLVDGEAALELARIVRGRWKRATGEPLRPVRVDHDPWPREVPVVFENLDIAIACTEPEGDDRAGTRHVEQLYLDMIARARRYIYIENQYFTSHLVGDALAARLADPHGPEVVLVTRLLSHGWLEEVTMHVLRTRLIRRLREADRHGRFQVYFPHVEGLADGTCVDVHSKMMAIDDEWLRIGSSNLSNRSMGLDTECDLVIEARGDAAVARGIRQFRDRLLAEHLDVPLARISAAEASAGSLLGAIASLQRAGRSLRELQDLKEWPVPLVEAIAITDPERPVTIDGLLDWDESRPAAAAVRRPWGRIAAFVVALIALALAWRYTPLADLASPERVSAWAEDLGGRWWAPFAVVFAYTPASLILLPRPLVTLVGTLAFGPWLGFSFAVAGMLVAGAITYSFGRLLERSTVERLLGDRLTRVSHVLQHHGLPAVIAVRFMPIAPYWVVNTALGAIRVIFWQFLLGTLVGVVPGALAATVFGDQVGAALKDPADISYGLLAAVAAFFVTALVLAKRWVSRRMLPPVSRQTRRPCAPPAAARTPKERAKSRLNANVT